MNKIYPFKFLDAYDKNDTGLFFGRDEEINALYQMVFQSNILMVYGASGTGKTSLIQCGLASKFQSHDWLSLFIRRGNNLNTSFERVLADAGGNTEPAGDSIDLSVLDDTDTKTARKILSPLARSLKAVYLNSFRPIYLIFDQFEELFIIGTRDEQAKFITTVQEILQVEQPVKMIFSIREEYLGYLYDLEKAVPQLMRKKLRVEPMNLDKVRQVINGIATFKGSNISLKKGEEQAITESIFDKIKGGDKTLTIQLPYLQVFMDKLYLQTTHDETRTADAVFSMNTIEQMGDIGDVLRDFLEEQVKAISQKLSTDDAPVPIDDIWKILSPFATLEGTKDPITMQNLLEKLPGMDSKLVGNTVNSFVNSRILRYTEEGNIYELAHDTLAKKIAAKRSDEEIELLEVKRLIKNQVNQKKDARELFSEKQLTRIDACKNKLTLTDEEDTLITASRNEIRRKKRIKSAQVTTVIVALVIVMIIITFQWHIANKQKNYAILQSKIATQKTQEALHLKAQAEYAEALSLQASKNALTEKSFAELQKNIADSQVKIAERQTTKADQQSKIAQEQKAAAQQQTLNAQQQTLIANQQKTLAEQEKEKAVAAQSEADRLRLLSLSQNVAFISLQIKNDPQLAALLANEAYMLAKDNKGNVEDPQIYNALYQSIKNFKTTNYPPVKNVATDIAAMDMSADGTLFVILANGSLSRYSGTDNKTLSSTDLGGGTLNTAYLSQGCGYAVTAYDDNSLRIWNAATGQGSPALQGHSGLVRAAAFSTDGSLVITGGRDSSVITWKNNQLQQQVRFPSRIRALALSDNNNYIYTGCEDGLVYQYDISRGNRKILLNEAPARIQCIQWVSHNNYMMVTSSAGQVTILNRNGQLEANITQAHSVDFITADDESGLLAEGTGNHQIWVYNVNALAQKPLGISDVNTQIKGLALSKHGKLSVACSNNMIREYSVTSELLQGLLSGNITRNLTQEEWNTFIGKDVPYNTKK